MLTFFVCDWYDWFAGTISVIYTRQLKIWLCILAMSEKNSTKKYSSSETIVWTFYMQNKYQRKPAGGIHRKAFIENSNGFAKLIHFQLGICAQTTA